MYLGLHIGEVFYGNVGSRERLDFTVIGPAVNETSRIAAMCRSVEQPILVSADFANVGGRPGGAITAACYLARFTRKLRWAHLDVAGTAWKSGREKGSTARPVPLLVRFAMRHAGKK